MQSHIGGIMEQEEIYNEVTKMLLSFGIPTSGLGFDFLRHAVLLCYEKKEYRDNLTHVLYPTLAKKFNTNALSVERNIRTAIENAYKLGGLLSINDYFGVIIYKNNYKPSNGELICLMVELIKINALRNKCNNALVDMSV